MPASNGIRGNKLTLTFGSPAVDHACDVTAVTLTNEEADSDTVTFCEAEAGPVRDYFLNITAIQSTDEDSLWSLIWEQTGTEVAYTYAPHGNAVPTADQPHFTGMVEVGPRPQIGGEASTSRTNRFTFESQWPVVGVPTVDRGA